jgi:large subunit ribosomal protein L13
MAKEKIEKKEANKKTEKKTVKKIIVFDADGAVVGRLAAVVAHAALEGNEVRITNAEKAVFSGNVEEIVRKYYRRRLQQDKANPEHSPHWPRRPDLFFKRVVRGMLPWHTARGAAAFRRVIAFYGAGPSELQGAKREKAPKTQESLGRAKVSVSEVCALLGWTPKH